MRKQAVERSCRRKALEGDRHDEIQTRTQWETSFERGLFSAKNSSGALFGRDAVFAVRIRAGGGTVSSGTDCGVRLWGTILRRSERGPRPGQLTRAEVDALIAQGLTVADLTEQCTVATMAITTADEHVDPKWFNFKINRPTETEDYSDYAALRAHYSYLDSAWDSPFNKAQTDETGAYIQRYYPALTGQADGVEYEVKRVSYHDTTVYRIGNVVINTTNGEQRYVYVSSEVNTGAASHFILPDDGRITVEYGPKEYNVYYEVYLDGVAQAAADLKFGSHAIFGSQRPSKTTDQHVSADVTIPAGYYARVYIGDADDRDDPDKFLTEYTYYADKPVTSPYEQFPTEGNYGKYPLGMGPEFTSNGNNVLIDSNAEAPSFFSLTGKYDSGAKGSANAPILIRVVLGKRTQFKISNELWGQTMTGEVRQQDKIKGNLLGGERNIFITKDANGKYILDESKYDNDAFLKDDGTMYQRPTDVDINPDDRSYSFTWTFTTKTVDTTGQNGNPVSFDFELRSLSVNSENVELPFINNPTNAGDNASTEKIQIQGATVQVRVTAVENPDSTHPFQRRYDIAFTNVTRNIIITTSALGMQQNSEFIVSNLTGVELQLWAGPRNDSSDFGWKDRKQGITTLNRKDGAFDFDESDTAHDNANARFKLVNGYELKDGGVEACVTYTHKTSETDGNFICLDQPDNESWYYLKLEGTTTAITDDPTNTYILSIEAKLKKYQVHYMNGVNESTMLQAGIAGLPEKEDINDFPNFTEWTQDEKHPGLDTNAGNYYDLVSNDSILINASIPTDGARRPAVFQFWVLTDKDGNPIKEDGTPISSYKNADGTIDMTKLVTVKGDTLMDLQEVSNAAEKDTTGKYTFCLTACWEPAAEPFVYYITFNKIDENGAPKTDVYAGTDDKGNPYPMVDVNNDPIGGGALRYAAIDRHAYAKVSSSTIVFDPDSTVTTLWQAMAGNTWYKLDPNRGEAAKNQARDSYLYAVKNYGEVDVWFT